MSVTLNMIVKNESKVIKRCLDSVKDHIDNYVICDTGSTDDTIEIIRKMLKDKEGSVLQHDWVDFSTNRNLALSAARKLYPDSRWILTLDADEVMRFETNFEWPAYSGDAGVWDRQPNGYLIETQYGNLKYGRLQLINPNAKWKWEGVIHELLLGEEYPLEHLAGVVNYPSPDGARSQDPDKFVKDAFALRKALRIDPSNARNWFYAAQSWKDAGFIEEAIACYQKRSTMAGFEEETWYSFLMIGRLKELLGDLEGAEASYRTAVSRRPGRNEAIVDLAHLFNKRCDFTSGLNRAQAAVANAMTMQRRWTDILFVDESYWTWRPLDELALALHYLGYHDEAAHNWTLAMQTAPSHEQARLHANFGFAMRKQK